MCAYVVVAEDDAKQADLARRYLVHDGHTVVVVSDGPAALEAVRREVPDLLVLDVMLPGMDGLDVCRIARAESGVRILMLTARSGEDDLLRGLASGADDYLTKPYSPRELVARARALLRRSVLPEAPAEPVLRVGPLLVDPGRHEVTLHDRLVPCTPGEFRLLEVMAGRPGRTFTRERLLAHLHGVDRWITQRTIDTHISNLRRKLEADPRRPRLLVTVYGVGYKLADHRAA